MKAPTHPRLEASLEMVDLLMTAGARLALEAADTVKRATARRRKGGITLRPGTTTLLWNSLAAALADELQMYGDKARLARVLGVPRQTINTWLTGHSRMPDAERTLQLLAWLLAKRRGQEPL